MPQQSGFKRAIARAALALSACALAWGATPSHAATVVNLQNFADLSEFQLNGATAGINTGGQGVLGPDGSRVLRLTDNLSQAGSAFLTNPFSLASDASFSSYFEFQFTDQQNSGADGIVFAVQTVANTAGGSGGGIGYAGLSPSIGVEFDNWNNGAGDSNSSNHAGIDVNGSVSSAAISTDLPALLDSGNIFHAWVDYDGANDLLEVRLALSDTRPSDALLSYGIDLVELLGTTDAFIGFTSGTGSAGADHDIRRWVFVGEFAPIQDPDDPGNGNDGGTVPAPAPLALLAAGLLAATLGRRAR